MKRPVIEGVFMIMLIGAIFIFNLIMNQIENVNRQSVEHVTSQTKVDATEEKVKEELNLYNTFPTQEEIDSGVVVSFEYCGYTYYYRESDVPSHYKKYIQRHADLSHPKLTSGRLNEGCEAIHLSQREGQIVKYDTFSGKYHNLGEDIGTVWNFHNTLFGEHEIFNIDLNSVSSKGVSGRHIIYGKLNPEEHDFGYYPVFSCSDEDIYFERSYSGNDSRYVEVILDLFESYVTGDSSCYPSLKQYGVEARFMSFNDQGNNEHNKLLVFHDGLQGYTFEINKVNNNVNWLMDSGRKVYLGNVDLSKTLPPSE